MAKKSRTTLHLEYRSALEKAIDGHEGNLSKHGCIRVLIVQGASNQMVLEVLAAWFKEHGGPKIKMADVRWNRNRGLEDKDLSILGHEEATTAECEALGVEVPEPAKRGRPRKTEDPAPELVKQETVEPEPVDLGPEPVKRKRGRPRKTASEPIKRSRGRPRKTADTAPETKPTPRRDPPPDKPRDIDPTDIEF